MKKIILSLIVLCIVSTVFAQNTRSLKKVIELQMPKTAEDELCGKRGAGVCWNPVTQKYYASFAGNAGFPLAVFDFKGKRLTADTVTTQIDTRGLWYNPKTKKISGNAYSDYGWFSYKLNAKGFPAAVDIILSGENQPEENSVGKGTRTMAPSTPRRGPDLFWPIILIGAGVIFLLANLGVITGNPWPIISGQAWVWMI